MKTTDTRPDTLTQEIGVLVRREVEARILAPVIDALGEKFGRAAVVEVVRDAIVELSRQQGAELSDTMGGKGCSCLLYTSPSPRDRTRSRMPSSA